MQGAERLVAAIRRAVGIPFASLAAAALIAFAGAASARTVVDFEIPELVHGTPAAAHLALSGTSTVERSYLPFYIVAFYRDAQHRADHGDPVDAMYGVRIAITWLAPKVDGAAMRAYWTEAFRQAATDDAQFRRLKPFVDKLATAVGPVERGDVVTFDYNPESGLHVAHRDALVAQIPGVEFNRRFLSIWLGDKAEAELRAELMGTAPAPDRAASTR